ncbi:hypothetical protein, partial [Streptomyces rhizosphaericus]|uniref:Uncharacterized protein n=1 Tax=Streptomyces rhizosphaericus TaxID=114699 RepID=A0ABN1TEU4_9ACTN
MSAVPRYTSKLPPFPVQLNYDPDEDRSPYSLGLIADAHRDISGVADCYRGVIEVIFDDARARFGDHDPRVIKAFRKGCTLEEVLANTESVVRFAAQYKDTELYAQNAYQVIVLRALCRLEVEDRHSWLQLVQQGEDPLVAVDVLLAANT